MDTGQRRWIMGVSAIAVLIAAAVLTGGVVRYAATPIEGRVIDSESSSPIVGATVLAHWLVKTPGIPEGQICTEQAAILEASTDEHGRFELPAWGPLIGRCPYGNLTLLAPRLLVFKSGYQVWSVSGQHSTLPIERSQWSSWVDRPDIRLEKFSGSIPEYALSLRFYNHVVKDLIDEGCTWRKIPLTLRALYRQDQDFITKGYRDFIGAYSFLIGNEYAGRGCPFEEDSLKESSP